MVNRSKKRPFPLFFLLFTFCLILGISTGANAQTKPGLEKRYGAFLSEGSHSFVQNVNNLEDGVIIGCKTNDTNIVKVSHQSNTWSYQTIGAGNAKVTVKVKKGKKIYKLNTIVHVDGKAPFQKIKLDGSTVAGTGTRDLSIIRAKGANPKIAWRLRPGYKLIQAVGQNTGKTVLKNGKKIKLRNGLNSYLHFYIEDKQHTKYMYVLKVVY